MKKLCEGFRDLAMKLINYEEKEMIPLTDEKTKCYEKQKVCDICKKNLVQIKMIKIDFNYTIKLDITVIIQEHLEGLLIIFVI